MKKVLLFIVFLIFVAGSVQSQGFYLRAAVGGGFGASPSLNMLYKYEADGVNQTLEVVPVDLGTGINGGIAFGYMFKKYFGAELMLSEFWGLNILGDSLVNIQGVASEKVRVAGNLLSLTPSVVISAGLEKVNPYARVGLLIGALPLISVEDSYNLTTPNQTQNIETMMRYYGGASLGYSISGGVDFNLNDLIALYVELSFMHSTWSPPYSEIVSYEIDGEDQLSTLTEKQKKTEYYLSLDLNEEIPDDSPDKSLRETYYFSTVGAMFGVKFKF